MAKQTYKVGPKEYLGNPPGSVVELDLPEDQEARALAAGHLSKSTATPKLAEPVLTPAAASDQVDAARKEGKQ